MSLIAQKLISASGATEATDDDFNLVTQLYQFDGTNGAQNNTFLDSSSNAFSVTRAGSSTQGTFSPFSAEEGKWSASFDGTDDYLSLPNHSDFTFGSGNWTVEAFVNVNEVATGGSAAYKCIYSASYGVQFYVIGTQLHLAINDTDNTSGYMIASFSTSGQIASAGVWYHVAAYRDGSNFYCSVDGVVSAMGTSSATIATPSAQAPSIGIWGNTSLPMNGYISNLRVIKGTALYGSSNFTAPSSPLTAVTNTKLLTCCSNRFRDKSTSAHTITPSSSPKIQPFSPFAPSSSYSAGNKGGSGYFDGSGDYLSVPNHADLKVGSSDFTLEAWAYINSTDSNEGICGLYTTTGNQRSYIIYQTDSTHHFGVAMSSDGTYQSGSGIDSGVDISGYLKQWVHLALTKSGTNATLYLNGTSIGTTSSAPSSLHASTSPFYVGTMYGASADFDGYIANVRLVKGSIVYASNFTPPTAPLTAITNTEVLFNFTNAAMFDQTGKTNLNTIGNTQLDTSIKKFGSASAKFDETGDTATITNGPYLRAGDFTIEGFVYFNSSPTDGQGLFVFDSQSLGNRAGYGPALGTYANAPYQGKWHSYYGTQASPQTGTQGNSEATPSATTWIHFAYVRTSGVIKIFIDGSQIGSDIAWTGDYIANNILTLGGYYSSSYLLGGNLDSWRVTLKARYTSNFTPPSEEFPNR